MVNRRWWMISPTPIRLHKPSARLARTVIVLSRVPSALASPRTFLVYLFPLHLIFLSLLIPPPYLFSFPSSLLIRFILFFLLILHLSSSSSFFSPTLLPPPLTSSCPSGASCDSCVSGWIGPRCDVRPKYRGEVYFEGDDCFDPPCRGGRCPNIMLKRTSELIYKRLIPIGGRCGRTPLYLSRHLLLLLSSFSSPPHHHSHPILPESSLIPLGILRFPSFTFFAFLAARTPRPINVKMAPTQNIGCSITKAEGTIADFPVINPASLCNVVDSAGTWYHYASFSSLFF